MNNNKISLAASKQSARSWRDCIVWFDRLVAHLTSVAVGIAAAAILVSLVLISYSVVMRYLFNAPPTWVDSVVGFLLIGIVMCSAADALRKGKHICVDLLTDQLTGKGKRIAALWGLLFVAIFAVFLIVDGWRTASFSKMLGIMTTGHLEIPIYSIQLLIPFGGIMLLLNSIALALRVLSGQNVVMHESLHGISQPVTEASRPTSPKED